MVPSPLYPTLDAFLVVYTKQLALNNTNGYLLPLEAFEEQDEKVFYWATQQWKDAFHYYGLLFFLEKKKSFLGY